MAVASRVLVTDGQDRSALAGVRSLHAAGYTVDVVAYGGPAAAQWSRCCSRCHTITDPRLDGGGAFVDELASVVMTGDYATIVVASDASLLAISRNRERYEPKVALGLPDHTTVERCVSKRTLIEVAADHGLASPRTVICETVEAAVQEAGGLGYPVVLKPQLPVVRGEDGRSSQPGGRLMADEAALLAALPRYGLPCLVQRHEPGPVVSFSGVASGGSLLAFGMSRYKRTWPPESGMASFAETVVPPHELPSQVEGLIGDLGWEGIFELELITRSDGGYGAVDFNPRLFGSLELVTRAGAPLAPIWCSRLLGGDAGPAKTTAGYRYRNEEGEVRNLMRCLRSGEFRSALALLRPRRRTVKGFFRINDPAPLLARLFFMLSQRLGWRSRTI